MRGKLLRAARRLIWLAPLPMIWWVLRAGYLGDAWQALVRLGPAQMLVLLLVNLAITFLFCSRWYLILRAQGYSLPYSALVGYRLAAFGVSYFTLGPQFGGEPLQVHLTHTHHGVPLGTSIAAVTLDKLIELLANFSFLTIGIAMTAASGLLGSGLGALALLPVIGLLALPAAYLLALRNGLIPLTRLVSWLSAHLPNQRLLRRLSASIDAAEGQAAHLCQRKPGLFISAGLLSAFVWTFQVAEFWLTLHFLGIELDLLPAIALLTAARLAFLMPSPGGLGTLEASQMIAMQTLGLNPALGLSLSLIIRARDVLFGGVGLGLAAALARGKPLVSLPSQAGD